MTAPSLKLGYGSQPRGLGRVAWRRWARHLTVAAAFAVMVWLVVVAWAVRGTLRREGHRSTETRDLECQTRADAARLAAHVAGPAFKDELIAASARRNPEARFGLNDLSVRSVWDDNCAHVTLEYRPWCRSRYSLDHGAWMLDTDDATARERNRALRAAFEQLLHDAATVARGTLTPQADPPSSPLLP